MTTPQVAINNLERSLKYAEDRLESNTNMYQKGIDHILKIRQLAYDILQCTEEILELQNVDMKSLKKTKKKVKKPKESSKKQKEVKKSGQVKTSDPYLDTKFKQLENLEKKLDPRYNIPRVYKQVTANTANKPIDDFKSKECYELSNIISEYFSVRFDPKYDPNHIHLFRRENFGEYLMSFIVTYIECGFDNNLKKFRKEIEKFISSVKHGHEKYTLPRICASSFFSIRDRTYEPNDNVKTLINRMWCQLLNAGYNEFCYEASIEDKYKPEFVLGTFIR